MRRINLMNLTLKSTNLGAYGTLRNFVACPLDLLTGEYVNPP